MATTFRLLLLFALSILGLQSFGYAPTPNVIYDDSASENFYIERSIEPVTQSFDYGGTSNFRYCCSNSLSNDLPVRIRVGSLFVLDGRFVATGGAGKALNFGRNNRKLDFLFNRNIDPSVPSNVQRAAGNAQRIGIADTPANRSEVIRRFNQSFNDPSSIVGPGRLPGSNVREFFLPGVTGTGSKIQFVEQSGRVITIIAR